MKNESIYDVPLQEHKPKQPSIQEQLLNLLKEKRVDLGLLSTIVANPKYKTAKRITNIYNTERRYWALALTEKEIELIVEWLKRGSLNEEEINLR